MNEHFARRGADFAISQVVDRTVGVHGLVRKTDLDRS